VPALLLSAFTIQAFGAVGDSVTDKKMLLQTKNNETDYYQNKYYF